MAVHAAGPRLYRSIRFHHLVKKTGGHGGARSSNISLNLVPFVDMMTILVCFLLMVFSANGQLPNNLPAGTNFVRVKVKKRTVGKFVCQAGVSISAPVPAPA